MAKLSSDEPCSAEVGAKLEAKGRRVRIRPGAADLDGATQARVKLPLSKRARKVAAKGLAGGGIKFVLAAQCTDAAGNVGTMQLKALMGSGKSG